jgi:hypothetical protein
LSDKTSPELGKSSLNVRLANELVYQMNIVRRQVSAYPQGHPVVRSSADRAISTLQHLHSHGPKVTIGVARDRLLFDATPLDSKNPVFQDYARALFAHGIIGHCLQQGLTAEELCLFYRLLACKPEELLIQGGVSAVMAKAGLRHLTVMLLDHSLFKTQEVSSPEEPGPSSQGSEQPWDRLAGALFRLSTKTAARPDISPAPITMEELVTVLNIQTQGMTPGEAGGYEQAVAEFIRDLVAGAPCQGTYGEGLHQFTALIGQLQPTIRRQLLASALSALQAHQPHAGPILSHFSSEVLADAVKALDARQVIPPFILQVLQQLASHGSGTEPSGQENPLSPSDAAATGQLEELLTEHGADAYVPPDYQAVLRELPARSQPGRPLPPEAIQEMMAGLQAQCLEGRLCRILCHLLRYPTDSERASRLMEPLQSLVHKLIDMGHFDVLVDIHRDFAAPVSNAGASGNNFLNAIFSGPNFVRGIMSKLAASSVAQRQDIFILIGQVGAPFIPLLLDSLAEEQDRSVRYKYLALLRDMGSSARDEIISRLQDPRWHLVRNLVTLLRDLGDPGIVDVLEPLLHHENERVRQEVLKTGLHFQDPRAETVLLRELGATGAAPSLWSILLARNSRDPRVLARLLALLREGGLTEARCSVRLKVIATLGDLGNAEALSGLKQVLFGVNLLHPFRHRRLQYQILDTLKSFPPETVAGIRHRLVCSLRPDLRGLRQRAIQLKIGTAT